MAKKVQIIEDESHIKALLIQTLETAFEDIIDDEELEILEANDGVEGLKIAKQEHPDLIFLDIMIPKIDGFEVCKKLKEDPSYKNTYIIMLTAKGQVVDKEKGLSVGANEYITKPFNPDFIISKVEEKLGFKRTY
ncbi:MAG TPA: response regulator [bacterium]|nr:response regulator [bacterium]